MLFTKFSATMLIHFYLAVTIFTTALASNDYIVGGNDVTQPGKWPWQGSLRQHGSHKCGISLIGLRWAVTAAHCIKGSSVSDLSVMFGSNKRTDSAATIAKVKSYVLHEDYMKGDGTYPNDIAVLEFTADVTGSNIESIPLTPENSNHTGNTDCWITGWGYTRGGGSPPVTLQEAKIDVFSNFFCIGFWPPQNINTGHVCVGDPFNGRASCNGDSGGPLVCKVGGQYELVGATSWGHSNCWTVLPSVYSRVAYFRSWISEKTGI